MSATVENPLRRRLLAGATAALAAGAAIAVTARAAPVASPGGASDDAELIRLCDEAQRLEARVCEIDRYGTSEEDCAAVTTAWDTIHKAIAGTPAMTLIGLQAKARALHAAIVRETVWTSTLRFDEYLADPSLIDENEKGRLDGLLARSLCADILGLGSDAA